MPRIDTDPLHRGETELRDGLADVLRARSSGGTLEMIVARPASEERTILQDGLLTAEDGLVGDDWATRGSSATPDGSAQIEAQLTIMSSRLLALIAGDRTRWPLAGDQLIVDQLLGQDEMPVGSCWRLGGALNPEAGASSNESAP